MEGRENKPMTSETLLLRPEANLIFEENCSGCFSDSHSVESNRDVALLVQDKGTSQMTNVNYTMYSEGPLSMNEDTNQENKVILGTPSWYIKKHPSSNIRNSDEFSSESSNSPSQYPLPETECGKTISVQDHCVTVGSGIPEKYFLVSPKDDMTDEQHCSACQEACIDAEKEMVPRKRLEKISDETIPYLRDISNIPSSRTSVPHQSASNVTPASHNVASPFTSSTPTSPYKIPVSTMPQFYWTITQQRREPMGSESTDSPGFSNTPLVDDSSAAVSAEQADGLRESTDFEQLPCTVVDITISPATSLTVYSDTDTVSADFRLIRPPLVGQSADGAITSAVQGSADHSVLSNATHENGALASSPDSDNDSSYQENDVNSKDTGCAEASNNQPTSTVMLHKISKGTKESITSRPKVLHNDNGNLSKTCAVDGSFKSPKREQKSLTDETLNYYNIAISGPSSLESQERSPHIAQPIENDKLSTQTRYYLMPSGLQQQLLTVNESMKHTKHTSSLDSNEGDLESGKSGYQSDNRATSPTSVSSVSSNRRLEWDNGADIGYSAVINAANNKFVNTFRSEPEGIPSRCRDSATVTINTNIVQQSSKHFNGRQVTYQQPIMSGSTYESSLQVIGEKVVVSNSKPDVLNENKEMPSGERNNQNSELCDDNTQLQFAGKSIGSRSSVESLSSNSTVKLVSKVGGADNSEIRSSLSSPLSEPIGHTFGKLVHFDKSLLKSKSDSSTLDVSSSVTTCMPDSRPASIPYINGSVYVDNCNDSQEFSQHQNGEMEVRSVSPETSQSSIEDEDICLSDQEVPLTLLESNAHLGQSQSVFGVPASAFVQGINIPTHGVFLAKSNISKSLSNLYDTTNKLGSTVLPNDMLPPEISDITSLRMYLEERYQTEISGLPSNTSPNENILMLNTSYEELEKDSLLADGPKIRWYPVTGSELPQDIRDASTQTAVSYLTQHGIHSGTVGVDHSENRTKSNVHMSSIGISAKELSTASSLLQTQLNSTAVTRPLHTKQMNYPNSVARVASVTSDTYDNSFIPRKEHYHTENSLQIHSKQIPIYHSQMHKHPIMPSTKFNSKNLLNTDLQDVDATDKCATSTIGCTLASSVIPGGDAKIKHVTAASFSDGEMFEPKNNLISRAQSIPLQLPPLTGLVTEKHVSASRDVQITTTANILNATQGINSMVILGTRLANGIGNENECEDITYNGFPKLDAKFLPKSMPLTQKNILVKQSVSRNIQKKGATTKLAVSTCTVPSVVPVTNYVNNHIVTSVAAKQHESFQTDIISVHRETHPSDGGVFVKPAGSNHSENHPVHYSLNHHVGCRRKLPHPELNNNVQLLQEASAPPYSSEYSKWKVVTEENSVLDTSSTASASSEIGSHSLLDENLTKSQATTTGTSGLNCGDERMRTQSLMSEIKNILTKRSPSSRIMRKYAVSNEADSEKSTEHRAMPSIHSETTMESTHTGSDDAEPPSFPPHAFGSRLNIETLSPGIYGARKYLEKYGKEITQNLKRTSVKKATQGGSNGSLISDGNWNSSESKPTTSSHPLSQHQISSDNCDSEQTVARSQSFKDSTIDSDDKHIPVTANSKYRLQGVGQDTSSTSVSMTQGQTSSTLDQTTLSSSIDGMYNKSISMTSSTKSNTKGTSKTDSSESAITDNQLLNRLVIADIGRPTLKPSQLAKRELEKLRHLVDRQKRSYIRRLQREVQRLERFEEVFLSESLKRLSSSSHCTVNNITNPKTSANLRNGFCSDNASSMSVPDSFLTSGNDAKNTTAPKNRTRKTSSRKESILASATRMLKHSHVQPVNDFGQSYPTPQPSFSETEKETADNKISVGIQTSALHSNMENKLLSKRVESRHFITLDSSPNKQKKVSGTKSSKYKDKTLHARKRKPSSHTVPKCIRQNIAWFVPINVKRHNVRNSSRSRLQGQGCISLQEAFHLNCAHVIKHSQARLIRISKLADVRQKRTALAMEKARIAAQLKMLKEQEQPKEEEEEKRRVFTHEEMREQTEKVYKKLPEVVEKKEKKKRDQQYKTNRLMAQIYNKKLQEQVLKGKVNWAITQSCFDGES